MFFGKRSAVLSVGVVLLVLPVIAQAAGDFTRDIKLPPSEELGPVVRLHNPGVPTGPPVDPQVGDSWTWWLFVWQPMPPHFEESVCTVRGISDRCYVVVRDDDWLVNIDQADVDSIIEHWENSSLGPYPDQGIYEIDSLSFGDPPDELDNDPRIYLVWYEFGINADGFFFSFDEEPDGTYPDYPSNECEVLYLNPTSTGGASGNYMHGVMAHEFQHMIHWKYDDDEASWVNEGLSELAMWFFGAPDNISSFNGNPDNDLTVWDGAWADYIQTYLWTLYFFERYGGHAAVYDLVHESQNSMAGYNAVLDATGYTENTEDVFTDWAVANFLDDTTIGDGRYGYALEDLPTFSTAGIYSSYPVSKTKTVAHWATDYYRFVDFQSAYMELTFDGADDNSYGVRALVMHDAAPTEVYALNLDEATQSGSVVLNDVEPDDEVILVVTSVSSTGGAVYSFGAGEALGVVTGPNLQGEALSLTPSANPFSGAVTLHLTCSGVASESTATIDVFDTSGRMVNSFTTGVSAESVSVEWNGFERDGTRAGAGIYYAVARLGTATASARFVKLS